jgi:hypothetical protein
VIDASSAEFAAADRFREEAARKSQGEAVDQEAREMEAAAADAEAAQAPQAVLTAEAEAAQPTASAAPEGMEMEH